ncbi:MAG: Rid family detoxifying hydrolase, partial [Rudaea sp.]
MSRRTILTNHAPQPIGPYSQAVRVGNTVYLSGQVALDPANGELVAGDIAAQTQRIFDNLAAVCEAAGGSLAQLARIGIYLTDLGNFAAVNGVMKERF